MAKSLNEIEGLIFRYPDEVKADVLDLYKYMVDKCQGNRKVLAAKLLALGVKKSDNYFFKLFSGGWVEKGVFTASSDAIKAMAQAVRDAEIGRLATGSIPHTETDIVKLMRNAIDAVRQKDNICKWLFVVGSTASQKSYSARYYEASRPTRDTFYMESPATANLMPLASRMSKFLGCADSIATYRKVQWVEDNAKPHHCFIIDNAQRMYEPRRGMTQPTFSFLQAVQDITKCTMVLIFVDEATIKGDSLTRVINGENKGFFDQFIGRCGGEEQILRLPEYSSDHDLLAFSESAGFRNPADRRAILPFLKYLDRQRGSMRIPLRALQFASRYAASQNRPVEVADFLQEISLKLPDSLQLKADELRKALPCA